MWLARDEMPLPTAPLVASLPGTFRAQEKDSKDACLRKEVGEPCRHAAGRPHFGSFVLTGFYMFSKSRTWGGGLKGGSQYDIHYLSRCVF